MCLISKVYSAACCTQIRSPPTRYHCFDKCFAVFYHYKKTNNLLKRLCFSVLWMTGYMTWLYFALYIINTFHIVNSYIYRHSYRDIFEIFTTKFYCQFHFTPPYSVPTTRKVYVALVSWSSAYDLFAKHICGYANLYFN